MTASAQSGNTSSFTSARASLLAFAELLFHCSFDAAFKLFAMLLQPHADVVVGFDIEMGVQGCELSPVMLASWPAPTLGKIIGMQAASNLFYCAVTFQHQPREGGGLIRPGDDRRAVLGKKPCAVCDIDIHPFKDNLRRDGVKARLVGLTYRSATSKPVQ